MADIFREIDEDIRRDNVQKLWKKHGRSLIAGAAAIVLGVAGIQGWRAWDLSQREDQSDRFAAAMASAAAGDSAAALNALIELSDAEEGGYRGLAALERARVLAGTGDADGAIAIWDRIADNDAMGPGFQGAATLLSVLHQVESGDPATLRQRLAPLAEDGQAFRSTAREILAALALRAGDRATARDLFTRISDDRDAPPNLRARATQLLAAIEE